jgi:hypothetical protein
MENRRHKRLVRSQIVQAARDMSAEAGRGDGSDLSEKPSDQ